MKATSSCRTYIVYHHGLFAQGVRSILERQPIVQIVGMENDLAKAAKAVRSLRPEVIVVEEPTEQAQSDQLGRFFEFAAVGRVVTLSLAHDHATIYSPRHVSATEPIDLVRAIHGDAQPESGRRGDENRSGQQPQVQRTRKREAHQPKGPPLTPRPRRKGG